MIRVKFLTINNTVDNDKKNRKNAFQILSNFT